MTFLTFDGKNCLMPRVAFKKIVIFKALLIILTFKNMQRWSLKCYTSSFRLTVNLLESTFSVTALLLIIYFPSRHLQPSTVWSPCVSSLSLAGLLALSAQTWGLKVTRSIWLLFLEETGLLSNFLHMLELSRHIWGTLRPVSSRDSSELRSDCYVMEAKACSVLSKLSSQNTTSVKLFDM